MKIYYNEFDRKAAAWLRELMAAKLIPQGFVDERSIVDVRHDELAGYVQCHFFAGIGGWPYALRLAGVSEGEPLWTASCPCQPFSQAGKGLGTKDPRHLWPVLRRLVGKCRPPKIFGEQVASAAGRLWLAGVRANMARMGYAVGASDLCAASVGAPQIRQRLYWCARFVGNTSSNGCEVRTSLHGEHDWQGLGKGCQLSSTDRLLGNPNGEQANASKPGQSLPCAGLPSGELADGANIGRERSRQPRGRREGFEDDGASGGLGNTTSDGRLERRPESGRSERTSETGGMGHADGSGLSQYGGGITVPPEQPATQLRGNYGFWSNAIWHQCTDGKARRISPEPALFPLAYGAPGRVGILRGAGNAIVPELAAEFIQACQEITAQNCE